MTMATKARSGALAGFENGPYLEQSDPRAAAAIRSLPWMRDGGRPAERAAVQELLYLAPFHRDLFAAVIGKPWVRDGVTAAALQVVSHLRGIAQHDADAALRIARMPFLNTLDGAAPAATTSLRLLAQDNPPAFRHILQHPTLRPGINDDWAKIVATLHGVAGINPGLVDALLNPETVRAEQRTVRLPRSGNVDLAIIRTGPGARRSMDLLELGVRCAEGVMAAPLPTGYVGALYEEAVAGSNAGTNFSTHIAIRPVYDVDDDSYEAGCAAGIAAHEVAHYYWNGNASWIDEGACDLLGYIAELERGDRPAATANYPSGYVRTIAELERLNPAPDSDLFSANYALGRRIFLDLGRALGDAEFMRGFRNLYRRSAARDDGAIHSRGAPAGINELRAAFHSAGSPAAVDRVIARWYYGTEPYDTGRLDREQANPGLPDINGRINRAYVTATERGRPVSQFAASGVSGPVWLTLEYSYKMPGRRPKEVHFEVVEFYQDGYETRRHTLTLTAEARYNGGTQWSAIGPPPGTPWAPGRHWVQVYASGRKVAEVAFEVTP